MDQHIETSELEGSQELSPILRASFAQNPDLLTLKAESMVRYSKQGNHKFFDASKQGGKDFVKASNVLLAPFGTLKRGHDQKALKQLRMPPDLGIKLREKRLLSLVDFCKQRNIETVGVKSGQIATFEKFCQYFGYFSKLWCIYHILIGYSVNP